MEHLRVNLSNVTTCQCGKLLVNAQWKDDKFQLVMKVCPKCSDEYIQMDKNYMKMARARNRERVKQEEAQAVAKAKRLAEEKATAKQREKEAEEAREKEQIALKGVCRKCHTSVAYLDGYCWECFKMQRNA